MRISYHSAIISADDLQCRVHGHGQFPPEWLHERQQSQYQI